MKKLLVCASVLFCIFTTTSATAKVATGAQGLFRSDGSFVASEVGKFTAKGVVIAATTQTGPILALGYAGYEFKLNKFTSLSALVGGWFTATGMSATFSLWFNTKKFFVKNLGLFAEVDYYLPLAGGHNTHSMYAFASLSYTFDKNVSVSLDFEGMYAKHANIREVAFGPALNFKRCSVWLAFDTTPNTPGETIFFRVSYNL